MKKNKLKTKKNGRGQGRSKMLVIYQYKNGVTFSLRPTKSSRLIKRYIGLKLAPPYGKFIPQATSNENLGKEVRKQLKQCDY